MASVHFSVKSIPLFHRPCAGLQKPSLPLTFGKSSPTHLNFRQKKVVNKLTSKMGLCWIDWPLMQLVRFKNEGRLQVGPRLHPVLASNNNPSEGSDETKYADAAQGPPFLTILAGFLVFTFMCWIIGSIVMWIISLIVYPPPLK